MKKNNHPIDTFAIAVHQCLFSKISKTTLIQNTPTSTAVNPTPDILHVKLYQIPT